MALHKILLSILIISSYCIKGYAQTLEEDKIDEFTNQHIKRTSWETLKADMAFVSYFRFSQIDSENYLELKMIVGGVQQKIFSISKGKNIMIKLSNDDIISIPNIEYAITCTGCGAKGYSGSKAEGIKVIYNITTEDLKKLSSFEIIKIRIYTNDGYIEEEIKTKNSKKVANAIGLLIGN